MGIWGFNIDETVSSEVELQPNGYPVNSRHRNQYNNTYSLADFTTKNIGDSVSGIYSGGLFDVELVNLSTVDSSKYAPMIFSRKNPPSSDKILYNFVENNAIALNTVNSQIETTANIEIIGSSSLVVVDNLIWCISTDQQNIYIFNPLTNSIIHTISFHPVVKILYAYGYIWAFRSGVGGFGVGSMIKIDKTNFNVVDTVPIPEYTADYGNGNYGGFIYDVISDNNENLWILGGQNQSSWSGYHLFATRINKDTYEIDGVDLGSNAGSINGSIAFDGSSIWVTNGGNAGPSTPALNLIYKINTDTLNFTQQTLYTNNFNNLFTANNKIFITNSNISNNTIIGYLTVIDPSIPNSATTYNLGENIIDMKYRESDNSLWATLDTFGSMGDGKILKLNADWQPQDSDIVLNTYSNSNANFKKILIDDNDLIWITGHQFLAIENENHSFIYKYDSANDMMLSSYDIGIGTGSDNLLIITNGQSSPSICYATIDYTSSKNLAGLGFSLPEQIKDTLRLSIGIGDTFNNENVGPQIIDRTQYNLYLSSGATHSYSFNISVEYNEGATPIYRIHFSIKKRNGSNLQTLTSSYIDVSDFSLQETIRTFASFEFIKGKLVGYINGVEVASVFDSDFTSFDSAAIELKSTDDIWIPSITWIAVTDSGSPSLDFENPNIVSKPYKFTIDQFDGDPYQKNYTQLDSEGGQLVTGIDFGEVTNSDISSGIMNGTVVCDAVDISTIIPDVFSMLQIENGELVVGSGSQGILFFHDGNHIFQPNGLATSFDLPMRDFIMEVDVSSVNTGWYFQGGIGNTENDSEGSTYVVLEGDNVSVQKLHDGNIAPLFSSTSAEVENFTSGKIVVTYSGSHIYVILNNELVYSQAISIPFSKGIPVFVCTDMTISKIQFKSVEIIENEFTTSFLDTVSDSDLVVEIGQDLNSQLNNFTPATIPNMEIFNPATLDRNCLTISNLYEKVSNYIKFIHSTDNLSKAMVWDANSFTVDPDTYNIDFFKSFDINSDLYGITNTGGEIKTEGKYSVIDGNLGAQLYKTDNFNFENQTFTISFGGFSGDLIYTHIVDNLDIDPHIDMFVFATDSSDESTVFKLQVTQLCLDDSNYLSYFVRFNLIADGVSVAIHDFPIKLSDGDLLSIRTFQTTDLGIVYYFNGIPIGSHLIENYTLNSIDSFGANISNISDGNWIPSFNWMSSSSGTFFDDDIFGFHRYWFIYELVNRTYQSARDAEICKEISFFGPNIELKTNTGYSQDYNGFSCDPRIKNFVDFWVFYTGLTAMANDGLAISGSYTDLQWSSIVSFMKNSYNRKLLLFLNELNTLVSPDKTNSAMDSYDIGFWPADVYFTLKTVETPTTISGSWTFNGSISLYTEVTAFKFLVQTMSTPLMGSTATITIKDSDTDDIVYTGNLPKSGNYFNISSIGEIDTNKIYDFTITGTAGIAGNGVLTCVISGDNLDPISTSATILVLR